MVDKNISAECLKPELWTHLQEILDLYCPPGFKVPGAAERIIRGFSRDR